MSDYRNDNRSFTGGTIAIFLIGAAVGAAAALLYAPMSGEETRANIADKAGEWKDKAADMKSQVAEKAGQWKEMAASKLQNLTDSASDTFDAAKDGAANVARTVKNEASNVANEARS